MFDIFGNRNHNRYLPSKSKGIGIGLLIAGFVWWLFQRRKAQQPTAPTGQQPMRSHIRLSSHPARMENPI